MMYGARMTFRMCVCGHEDYYHYHGRDCGVIGCDCRKFRLRRVG